MKENFWLVMIDVDNVLVKQSICCIIYCVITVYHGSIESWILFILCTLDLTCNVNYWSMTSISFLAEISISKTSSFPNLKSSHALIHKFNCGKTWLLKSDIILGKSCSYLTLIAYTRALPLALTEWKKYYFLIVMLEYTNGTNYLNLFVKCELCKI